MYMLGKQNKEDTKNETEMQYMWRVIQIMDYGKRYNLLFIVCA